MLYGLVGLIMGLIIAWSLSIYAVNGNHPRMMRAMGMHDDTSTPMMHNSSACNGLQCAGE